MASLPRTVVFLGLVSLFTDLSSEMIYPLLPVFLSSVLGAGTVALGTIEGFAESTASLLKVASGLWTDRRRTRKPLIFAGYGLSAVMRPLIGLASSWQTVLGIRMVDRVGKGLRSSPRDALIADVTSEDRRGAAYGFHRSMDHAGAVGGPLIAAGLLLIPSLSMRDVFLLAAVPGALAVGTLLYGIQEKPRKMEKASSSDRNLSLLGWSELTREFKLMLLALIVFTLGNSTDAFLLVRLNKAGVSASAVALLWSLHHVVKMISTYYGGRLSDDLGRRRMVIAGWLIYALVYLAFGMVESQAGLIAVFLAYGLYFGLTEPVERAWVSDLVPPRLRGTAFGYYHLAIGLGALPASILFGFLWQGFGAMLAFGVGAALAGLACGLAFLVPETKG